MTKPIKLIENDFDFIHWEKDSGQEKETFELMIHGKSELHCMQIKSQILENQKIINNIKERIRWLESFGKNVFSEKYTRDVIAELENIVEFRT